MPRTALEPLRDLKYFFNLWIGLHLTPEFRYLFKCLAEADVSTTDRRRYQFGDALHFGVRHFERPAYILDRRLRGERPEGDDLADRVATIKTGNVIDNIAPAADTEIDIDVGQRDAARVQKPLEEQV